MSLLPLWFVAVFALGLLAGGFVNYCARRLPFERSLLWPGPRCLKCCHPRSLLDRVPVLGYALRGGRCRGCRAAESLGGPLVELLTGGLFVALFAAVVGAIDVPNVGVRWGHVAPGRALAVFGHYAILLGFLLVASLCDLADMEIPFSLTLWGTFVGLVLATLLPYPFPLALGDQAAFRSPYPALYPWPIWHPNQLPAWLPLGSPQLGLATGLAGAVAGALVLRAVGFWYKVLRGIEGMGVGDADLMMMAGAFLGWQPVVMAFFVAVAPGLLFAIVHLVTRGTQALPFGPSLAVGVVLTVLGWPLFGGYIRDLIFEPMVLGVFAAFVGLLFGLALMAWFLRWLMED